MKAILRDAFAATLAALRARQDEWTPRCLGSARDHIARGGQVVLVAFGKAARSMATSALGVLPAHRVRGLLVTPAPDAAALPPLPTIAAGHPLPDAGSFAAARAALEICRSARATEHVVFLVSGGGSALLELPYDDRIDVAAWRGFYRALVGCGAGIERINAIRRRVSAVKGGRLALAAAGAAGQTTVLVRDVPGGWGDIASGPTWLADADDPDALWLDDDALAREIVGEGITVLSTGTDGVDGNSPAAGAVADGATAARATAAGLDVADALRRCDAYPLFAALGDAMTTGPTGTNVRDVRILASDA